MSKFRISHACRDKDLTTAREEVLLWMKSQCEDGYEPKIISEDTQHIGEYIACCLIFHIPIDKIKNLKKFEHYTRIE